MAAYQAPPSLGFSRQEHWSGLPFPSPMHESEVAQSCLTQRPHGLQPTRLLCPREFPGKNTGVGCHCLLSGELLQEGLCHTLVYCTQSSCPCSNPLLTCTSTGDTHSSVSVTVGSLGPGAQKICLSPLSISGVYRV